MTATGPRARPTSPTLQPFMDRLVRLRCRLTYAQQRIRELEALLAEHGVEIPAGVTEVPPPDHQC
jgi:hypothetical protein